MSPYRIAIAGFQHETNTFAPGRADMAAFEMADSWPGLLRGQAVMDQTQGMNLPIAGAARTALDHGCVEVVPILWCAAEPCGPVTDDAFNTLSRQIIDGLQSAGKLDAIYLDLHGAMVTETHDDGEGELLARLRSAFGADLPIGMSLDLHANVTPVMVGAANLITIYRTYPHLDMADTGARCMNGLIDFLDGAVRHAAFRQVPFLVPLHAQFTGAEPCKSLYEAVVRLADSRCSVELAMGFTAADIHDCGAAIVAYATTPDRASELADAMLQLVCDAEPEFETNLLTADEAVKLAKNAATSRPVVIADVQDNPGAGGTADTTGLLWALVDHEIDGAVLGVLHDPEIARLAHIAGVGRMIEGSIGGGAQYGGDGPVSGPFRVLALSDGNIRYTGDMYGGGIASVGPSCLLAIERGAAVIRVVVSSQRTQCLDRAFFTHFGVDLETASAICVKSTVHYRADFDPIASMTLAVAVPGAFSCVLHDNTYSKLRDGMRLGPMGPRHKAITP